MFNGVTPLLFRYFNNEWYYFLGLLKVDVDSIE